MKTILFFLSFFLISSPSFSQVFHDRSDMLGEPNMHSAVPVAIADMNGDGLDDLVTMNGGTDLFIQYQTPDPNRPFVRYELPIDIDSDPQNDIIVADFNNDGANDIFTVGSYDRVKVLYAVPHTYHFTLTYVVVTPFFSQGATAGDFNGDGWMDVVMLNDNGLNYSMMNDGTGNLVHEEFFDFVTVPSSDNSGNYGSVFTDFDMDGDSDFYIAKCRQGINNPNDPRRINVLYVNDGNNNYTQDAKNYGLASGRQTWTADFGDIDNDGDLDCFMTQHDVISELFENIDNDTFINITGAAGLNIGGIPLQGMFRDFDNDGFQDILVSGDRVDYYRNNGDKTFTRHDLFGTTVFGTFSLGDLNHDGFTDIYASSVIPFNNPDPLRNDILYITEPNENNFLSLHLKNDESGSPAIGATLSLYGEWGIQVREVRAGEQYGVSNSHSVIFGLGQETHFDSLVIRWPDGTKETYQGLIHEYHWYITKGGCYITYANLWPPLEALCGDDSLVLNINDELATVEWSNGWIGDTIVIKEPGLYYATLHYLDRCDDQTVSLEVIKDPDSIKPTIIYEGNTLLCHGETATLSLPFANNYLWSNGLSYQTIEVNESGDYFAQVEGYCLTQNSDTIHIDFFVPEPPVVQKDTFSAGEAAVLIATGDSIVWYDTSGMVIIATGPQLVLNNLTTSTTYFAQNIAPIEGETFQLGPAQQQGNTKYNAPFVNGGLLFQVMEPIVLNDLTVYTDSAGTRIIEISSPGGFFHELQVDLDSGKNVIVFDLDLPPGEYEIGTNTDLNNLVFGINSPLLWRSSAGVIYPYEINGVVSITNSTFGSDFYYYFYDWHITTSDKYCGSDLVPVTAVLDTQVGTEETSVDDFKISPNPTSGVIYIQKKTGAPCFVEIFTIEGIPVMSQTAASEIISLELSTLPSGTYLMRIIEGGRSATGKVIRL